MDIKINVKDDKQRKIIEDLINVSCEEMCNVYFKDPILNNTKSVKNI